MNMPPPGFMPFASMPAAAPQAGQRPPEVRKKTGLLAMAPGSKHQIVVTVKGQPTRPLYTTAQHADAVLHALYDAEHPALYVCLHHACAGKAWKDERELRLAHPAPSDMAKSQAVHVWGLWSPKPADAEVAYEAKLAIEEAQKKVAGLKNADKEALAAAKAEVEAAQAAYKSLQVVGLIAPPEAKTEE